MPDPRCACCYDDQFDRDHAEAKLREYRRKGPGRTSRAIADALAEGGGDGRSVLDIGGGVGAVHQLLLERGAASATDVDASRPYLDAARAEAERRGFADRVIFRHGDFVAVAPEIEPADLVALDRVVCCYEDVEALVGRAAERTRRRLAITLPPDGRIARAVVGLANAWERVTRSAFRVYAHPHARVVAAARAAGLEPVGSASSVGIWRLLVFERPILTADSR
ncbi:MAG TPA: class I SAM-dependent methyltransferase [Candidatus Sulfomarinibacteraceae bacterium]|nr:class I SAM-dependent methyltransferase [Candidatus Sulfomarinibacteraceae bacterium]